MKKTPLGHALILLGIAFLVSCSTGVRQNQALRMATTIPVTGDMHRQAQDFVDNLKQLSGGKIQTEIFAGGVLGSTPQLLAQLRAGKLDFMFGDSNSPAMTKEGGAFNVMLAPFLFRDQEHYHRFLASDLYRSMVSAFEKEFGVICVGTLSDRSPRLIATRNRAVRTPEDLKGLKIRLPPVPFVQDLFRSWGATPTPLRGEEIYDALQTGLVEGDDNGFDRIFEAGLHEVLRYITPIDYVRSSVGIFMSAAAWNRLSEQERDWVRKAAETVTEKNRLTYDQRMEMWRQQAIAQGIEIVEPDMESFRRTARAVVQEYDGKSWPAGLYTKIQEIR